jgi:aerobic-type carbon monoxide dehydrogenase small subunit (CoxS/CutS family)
MQRYSFQANGKAKSVESWDSDQPLLYILRNTLGQCGACTGLSGSLGRCGKQRRIPTALLAAQAMGSRQ